MDEAAFTRTATAYKDRLFAIAFHYCKNKADAEDILQTVLLKYYRSDKAFATEEYLRNWLIRVTINESKRLLLSPWRRHFVPMEELEAYAAETIPIPEENALFLAVLALPQKYRIVVHLYYYEEYSVREIADLLAIRETTVQTRLMRARAKLKDLIKEAWEDEGIIQEDFFKADRLRKHHTGGIGYGS